MKPLLPAFVLACPATVTLILRVLSGELPRGYYEAWDALADPNGYKPSEEVRIWVHTHWKELVPPVEAPAALVPSIPSTLTIAHAPVLTEEWMQPFLAEYVRNGGVIIQAAKVALVHRDTVQAYRKHDREFARAFELAKEERRGLIRSKIKEVSIDGWEEPVYGRMDRVVEGKVITETVVVGSVRKFDNRGLLRSAEVELEEYAKGAQGAGTTVNVNANATASAAAQASSVAISAEMIADLQARNRRQLERQAQREAKRIEAMPPP